MWQYCWRSLAYRDIEVPSAWDVLLSEGWVRGDDGGDNLKMFFAIRRSLEIQPVEWLERTILQVADGVGGMHSKKIMPGV